MRLDAVVDAADPSWALAGPSGEITDGDDDGGSAVVGLGDVLAAQRRW
jgi:hypothetical protein